MIFYALTSAVPEGDVETLAQKARVLASPELINFPLNPEWRPC